MGMEKKFVLSAVFVLMLLSVALGGTVREWSASDETYKFRSEGKTLEVEFLFEDISDYIQVDAFITEVYLEKITETEGSSIEFNQTICYAPIGENYRDCPGVDVQTDVIKGAIHEEFYSEQIKTYSYNKGVTGEHGSFYINALDGFKVKIILTSLTDDDFKLIEQSKIYPDNTPDDSEDDSIYTMVLWVRGETIYEPETDLVFQEFNFDGNVSTEFIVPIKVFNGDEDLDIEDVEIFFNKTGCVVLNEDSLSVFSGVSANTHREVNVKMLCDEPGTYYLNDLRMFFNSENNVFEKESSEDKNVTIVIPEPPKPVIFTKITKVSQENEYPIKLDFEFKNTGNSEAKSIKVVENSDLIDFEETSVTTHSVSPEDSAIFSVKVIPLKDKVELIDFVSVEFEDLLGNTYATNLPPLIINYEKIDEIKAVEKEKLEEEARHIPPLQTFLVKNESNIPLFLMAVLLAFAVYVAYEKKKKGNPIGLDVFR